ncbi:hypothetical protein MYX84_07660 [Acidobacteria bacterium AH-259-O06]|nr:hypothetical protein [Acidobacteria bacterium AH-259-O06]
MIGLNGSDCQSSPEDASNTEIPKSRRWSARFVLIWSLIFGSLGLMYGGSLIGHMKRAADPLTFNDDSRQQIWPFLRYHASALFRDDYIAQYYLDCMPAGYGLLYRWGSGLWDPRAQSKVLPYLLLPVLLVSVGAAAGKIGGRAAVWGAIALCLSSGYYLWRMTGGLPRGFAYPVLGCAAAALVFGQPYLLALTVCIGAAFYPQAGVVAGLALAIYLLVLPKRDRVVGATWSLHRRVLFVGATALLSLLIILSTVIRSRSYGPLIRPHEVATYPEAGPGGRYDTSDTPPFNSYWGESKRIVPLTLTGVDFWERIVRVPGRPWPLVTSWMQGDRRVMTRRVLGLLIAILCVGGIGSVILAAREPPMRRLVVLAAAAVVTHGAAVQVVPYLYLPPRYVEYPLPILIAIMLPAGSWWWGGWLARWLGRPWLKDAGVVFLCAICVLGLGNRGSDEVGFTVAVNPNWKIYPFLASLPPDVLIAGWPTGVVDNVPYVCARRALITSETHQIFHRRYLLEMRRRMVALIDAYFATDSGPLFRLQDEFGVTHLLLDQEHYLRPPAYFRPYTDHIHRAFEQATAKGLEAARQFPWAGVYQEGPLVVLDLRRLRRVEISSH